MEKIRFFDRQTLPNQSVRGAHVVRSVSGDLQLLLDAPQIDVFQHPEAKTVYPKGFSMRFFAHDGTTTATVSARYGISYDSKQIMEARDSVVIIDHRTGDTVYLCSLVWNSLEERIYSNDSIRSVNGRRVTYGDGFESDENFTNPQILHQRGTIEWNE